MFAVRREARWWLALMLAISHVWAFGLGLAFRAESAANAQTTTAETPTEQVATEETSTEETPTEEVATEEVATEEVATEEVPLAEEPPAEEPVAEEAGGTGTTAVAEDLDPGFILMGATVDPDGYDLEDGIEEYVIFTFTAAMPRGEPIADPAGFSVRSDSGPTLPAASATPMYGFPTQVKVGFPNGTDLNRYATASVREGIVLGPNNRGNVAATVTLAANPGAGPTRAPDFINNPAVDATLNRVTYTFDVSLDEEFVPEPSNFGYRTASGKDVVATSVIVVDDTTVVVQFDDVDTEAVRYFVRAGAVQDRLGKTNPPRASGPSNSTTAPELRAVAPVLGSTTQYDFTFTAPIMPLDVAGFALYTEAGNRYDAEDWERVAPDTVRLYVPSVKDFVGDVDRGTVDAGAVQDTSNSEGVVNGVGQAPVPAAAAASPGTPNLDGGTVDPATGQVTFMFSLPLDDDVDIDPANFLALAADGDLVPAKRFIEVNGSSVVIQFDARFAGATVQFLVKEGAVQSDAGILTAGGAICADTGTIVGPGTTCP